MGGQPCTFRIQYPDTGTSTDIEDVMKDFLFGDWSCEELASKNELEFVVLEVEAISFDFIVRKSVGSVLGM